MKYQSFRRMIVWVLILCLPFCMMPASALTEETGTASGLEELIAGVVSVEDLYGELDEQTVPEIIGYEYAKGKAHIQRLYDEEGDDLNRVVFQNADGTQTMYLFDFPVKYLDADGKAKDITLDIADGKTEGTFETA